jgi:hypothetical protein
MVPNPWDSGAREGMHGRYNKIFLTNYTIKSKPSPHQMHKWVQTTIHKWIQKLWCNSCTFIVISQMLINYNVCFFWQKIVMVPHTHTHTHTIVPYIEWKLLSKLFSFLSTYILRLKPLRLLLQAQLPHALMVDWIKARNHFKLSNPMP